MFARLGSFAHARLLATLLCVVTAPSSAQGDAVLYEALGGQPGVTALVDRFATRLYSDAVTGPFFVGVDPVETRRRLGAQFCDLSGGPCKTVNPDMKKTHAGMDIRPAHFDAVMELLRQSLDDVATPAEVQRQFLDLLHPLQSDIVNTP